MNKLLFLLLLSFSLLFSIEITPIPQKIMVNNQKANLGKKLFNDKRLSIDDTISCASCHILSEGGDDNMIFSTGVGGKLGNINSPSVYNSIYNFRQFWDGRASSLEEQALGPIENPLEMANNFKDLIIKLKKTEYKELFSKVFNDGITKNNIVNAIAEYEKTLITPNSPFDKYLNGDKNALSEIQKEGYELFKSKGCISCHHGINIGGNLYNKLGVMSKIKTENFGRYNLTKKEKDKYYFKVPSLRNVAETAPYFHDGRTYNLHDVVKIMSFYQLGRPVSEIETTKIVEFLKSLTGEFPESSK